MSAQQVSSAHNPGFIGSTQAGSADQVTHLKSTVSPWAGPQHASPGSSAPHRAGLNTASHHSSLSALLRGRPGNPATHLSGCRVASANPDASRCSEVAGPLGQPGHCAASSYSGLPQDPSGVLPPQFNRFIGPPTGQ